MSIRLKDTIYDLVLKSGNSDKLDDINSSSFLSSLAYNYTSGCLVRTDIPAKNNTMITFRIEGNTYGSYSSGNILTIGQFYDYSDSNSIDYNTSITHFGYNFGDITLLRYNGYVYLWFKQTSTFQSFIVKVFATNTGSIGKNRVISISNSALPTGSAVTSSATITSKTIKDFASGTWEISISGNAATASSVAWGNITGKPSTFTPATHTHNYASTVKVGTTSYSSTNNIISLPAYPTSLKNPTSLTIQANGTSLGSYDGSAAKTFNITYSNVGAAASSHTHSDYALSSHTHTFASLTSKPTTLSGYGITDAYTPARFGGVSSHSGYYKIKINSTKTWMLAFRVRVYKSYQYFDIRFSGYQYGTKYWNSPVASLVDGDDSITVYFGYDSTNNLWVGIPAGNYTGIEIVSAVNGYTQHEYGNDLNSLFTISNVSSLSTIQSTQTIYPPSKTNHTHNYAGSSSAGGAATSANKLTTARTISLTGSVTGSGSFDGSGNLSIATTTNHTHSYAGSSSAGGPATSANKLNTNAGNATTPVYFSEGVPVACSVASGAATASTIAVRNNSGDIFARLIRQTYADQSTISGGIVFRINNSSDNYLRVCNSPSAIRTFLGVPSSNDLGSYLPKRRMENPDPGHASIGAIPFILSLKAAGTALYEDPEFESDNNSVKVYNNAGNGAVTITRIADNQYSGNSSGYILKISTSATSAGPGRGGFYQSMTSRAGAIFCQIFRAKIPTGYTLANAENSMGTSYKTHWLTSKTGTGKWEWYCRVTFCGTSGTFSSGGHVYLNADAGGTAAVTWYLSYCNTIDLTKANYDGLRSSYAGTATQLASNAGSATNPIYFSGGKPVACTYSLNKTVPSNAVFTDTTYSAGSGLSLSGTTFNHASTVTAGTVGTSSATSGSTLAVPYVTVNATGHVTGYGTHTHTITGFASSSHNHDSVYSKLNHTHSYVPLAGGTMTGDLTFDYSTSGGAQIIFKNGRIVEGGGGWADKVLSLQNSAGTSIGTGYGIHGSGNVLSYIYLGHSSDYTGNNFRIYSDRITFGNNTVLHVGNYSTWAATKSHNHDSEYAAKSHTHSQYYDSGASRTANTVLAAPNGSAGSATFRKLVTADIPALAISKITNLQSTLDGKAAASHTHNYAAASHTHSYAGSSSAGGAATSANKLNTNAGTAIKPVYFSGGVPVEVTAPMVQYWAIYEIYWGSGNEFFSAVKKAGNYEFYKTCKTQEREGQAIITVNVPSGFTEDSMMVFGNGDHVGTNHISVGYLTIGKQVSNNDGAGTASMRVSLSDDASLNYGYAYLYFLCIG